MSPRFFHQTRTAKMELEKPGSLTPEQIKTLAMAGVIPPDTPPAQVSVFAAVCKQHALSPFTKEIYLVKYGTAYNVIVGIDGMRKKAARTGQHGGTDEAVFDKRADGTFRNVADFKPGELPKSCTVTVWRIVSGVRCPYTATVSFAEFYPAVVKGQGSGKPAQMPFNMIAKCAEAKALKMAFGDEFAGLHIEEERAAFEGATIQAAQMYGRSPETPERAATLKKIREGLESVTDADGLGAYFNQNKEEWGNDREIIALFSARENQLMQQ